MSSVRVVFLPSPSPAPDGWSRYASELASSLEDRGIVVCTADMPQFGTPLRLLENPLACLAWALRLRSWIQKADPLVLHVTAEPFMLLVPFLPLGGRCVVLTVHGSYAYLPDHALRLLRPLYRALYVRALRRVSTVIAVSRFTKEYLMRRLQEDGIDFDPDRIVVIPNGIRVSGYQYKETPSPHDGRRILTVAPVKGRKGIIESLRAVASYRTRYGDVRYRVVGTHVPTSAYGGRVAREIRSLGLTDVVTFTGRLSEEALRDEYAAADVFLMLPIVKEPYFEGFGLVYLEANACGVPAVGSKAGGSAEAIQDGVSGFLVDAHDPESAAARLDEAIRAGTSTRASARRWAQEHDVSRVAERVASLYDQAAVLWNR